MVVRNDTHWLGGVTSYSIVPEPRTRPAVVPCTGIVGMGPHSSSHGGNMTPAPPAPAVAMPPLPAPDVPEIPPAPAVAPPAAPRPPAPAPPIPATTLPPAPEVAALPAAAPAPPFVAVMPALGGCMTLMP